MKDVILWELRRRRTALFWWTVGSVAMTVMILTIFPSIRDQATQMNELLNRLPPEIRNMKAGGAATVDVSNPLDFLNSQLYYATLPLIWIILAVTRGSSTLGRDESHKTLELLLARPISRTKLLLAKFFSFAAEFLIVGGATLLATLLVAPMVDMDVAASKITAATFYTTLFCMSFGVIAFALQAFSLRTKRMATAIAVTVGFGGYLLASLASLTDWLEWPAKLFPYHYFMPLDVLNGKTPSGLLVYLVGAFGLGLTLAIIGFKHRDIE